MQNNYIQAYLDYFSAIHTSHKLINDFKIFDIDEAIGAAYSGNMQYPCLVLDTIKGMVVGNNEDNSLNSAECGFIVLSHVSTGDFQAEMQALVDSIRIGFDIIAKMNADQSSVDFLLNFSPSTVKWQTYGPVLDNCYGTHFTFKISQGLDLEVDSEVWES